MTLRNVVFSLSLVGFACSHAAAQEAEEFTLSDVESEGKPPAQPPPAAEPKQAIKQALGELQWGMSKADLVKMLKAQIRADFEQRIKVERDIMRQDAIYQESKERARRLGENFISFDGAKSGWDVSPIASEFTRDNREAMLVVAGKGTRDMYFFIQGKLWKWYRELDPEAVDESFSTAGLTKRFGTGKPQQERRDDANEPFAGLTWMDPDTRLTAMRRGPEICLIFEDRRTLEILDKLRFRGQASAKKSSGSVVDLILFSDAELKERAQ